MFNHRSFAVALALLSFAGCRSFEEERRGADREKREAAEAQLNADKEAREATEKQGEAEQAWREEAARYQKSVMGELVDLDRELVDLRTDASKLSGDERAEADASIRVIEERRATLRSDLDALETSTATEHADLKERIQRNLDALDDELESASRLVKDMIEEG